MAAPNFIVCAVSGLYCLFIFRDRFLKKKCGKQTVEVPGLANGERGAVGAERVGCPPPHWGRNMRGGCAGTEPLPRKKSILDLK